MIRSVTRAIVGCRVIAPPCGVRGSFVPAYAVTLGQRDSGGRPPGTGGIRTRKHTPLCPGGADLVGPGPLRLDLVAADEQRRVSLDQIEQQPFIGDPPAIFAECVGKT